MPEKNYDFIETIEEDESLSLQDKGIEMIKKSLEKNNNKRIIKASAKVHGLTLEAIIQDEWKKIIL